MTPQHRRKAWLIFGLYLATLGSVQFYLWKDDLWYTALMSHAALLISALAGWAAETPVELQETNS